MKTTIVCGVDFSGQSANALRYAAALADAWSGQLRVVHAIEPMLTAAAAYAGSKLERETKVDLARFTSRALGASRVRRVRSVVRVGRPAEVLLGEAERCRPSLIVMGTHGLRGLARVLVGSIAEGVVRRARVPVLVVPRRCVLKRRRASQRRTV